MLVYIMYGVCSYVVLYLTALIACVWLISANGPFNVETPNIPIIREISDIREILLAF